MTLKVVVMDEAGNVVPMASDREFRTYLTLRRKKHSLSLLQVAEGAAHFLETRVSRQTVANWEHGTVPGALMKAAVTKYFESLEKAEP